MRFYGVNIQLASSIARVSSDLKLSGLHTIAWTTLEESEKAMCEKEGITNCESTFTATMSLTYRHLRRL